MNEFTFSNIPPSDAQNVCIQRVRDAAKAFCDVLDAVDELFKALPRTKQGRFIGHLNDILLFLEAAKQAAPAEKR